MPTAVTTDDRYTSERYFRLAEEGVLEPDDRVELLDGVIVAMAPSGPRHATVVNQAAQALIRAVASRAAVRVQVPLVASAVSAPEPDVAVVPGVLSDYLTAHPTTALLVLEVSDSSLPQDRITKARIYAGASVPEYWILNLSDDFIEVQRTPDPAARCYGEHHIAHRGDRLDLLALPGAQVSVEELLPAR